MDRKHFLKSVLLTTGGVLLGGTTIYRYLNSKETTDASLPSLIDKIHQGNMKKILVIMSAGTKRGNTDRLTDAYIKGLVERGHSVTKVYLGNMRIEGCRGCGVCQRLAHQCAVRDGMEDIYPLFAACDTVVMASPLYFWTITAKLKSFIDRLYAISVDDKYPQKDSVLLMTVRLNLPSLPFFVVMTMAPLAASEPYKAAAAAPVKTDIDSMSSGLMSAIGSEEP